ncbi:HNH endonuclease [Sphingomonas aliaeris]|uniref:HNH endonuclease n=1 Tax=Sphingomonas aliaeris TaxID=2759526 RepID=A0A974S5W0_9SPHN|nr:HNH endonuclease [Sphingomonas aliaeris]
MVKLTALPNRLASLPPRLTSFTTGDKGRFQANPWRAWYSTPRWRAVRLRVFERDGYTCQWPGCGRVEGNTSLLVADHDKPHHGDPVIFWDEDGIKTLCKPCHDGPKQRAEIAGRL